MKARTDVRETILVVEDDILVRMPIAQYLQDCGYRVIETIDGAEAMTVLTDHETTIHIVFSAIEMPGAVDGFRLAKRIRQHRPDLDVLLASNISRAVQGAKTLCEQGPIPKPYDAQVVHSHIRRLLAARKSVQDE